MKRWDLLKLGCQQVKFKFVWILRLFRLVENQRVKNRDVHVELWHFTVAKHHHCSPIYFKPTLRNEKPLGKSDGHKGVWIGWQHLRQRFLLQEDLLVLPASSLRKFTTNGWDHVICILKKKHFFQCNNFGSMTSSNQIATETVVHFAISLFHNLQWQWIDLKTASMIGGYRWFIPMDAHVWPKI